MAFPGGEELLWESIRAENGDSVAAIVFLKLEKVDPCLMGCFLMPASNHCF